MRKLRILIRVAKITCQVALPAAATANTEFYPGTITVCLHSDLMDTFVAGVKNEFFISPMFSQVVEAPGDDRAGEPLKEPWKHDANSLLFLPLGNGQASGGLVSSGRFWLRGSMRAAWLDVLGAAGVLVPYCYTLTCCFVKAALHQ